MLEQVLNTLREPGAVSEAIHTIANQRMPISFVFMAHHPLVSYADSDRESPPVLLVEPSGQEVSGELVRTLREPPSPEEAFCSGCPIRGWVIRDGDRHVFATRQAVPEHVISRGLATLASIAGMSSFARTVEVASRSEGALLLDSLKAARSLSHLSEATGFHIRTTGRPVLRLGSTAPPLEDFLSGLLSRRDRGLVVEVRGTVEQAERLRSALVRFGEMFGVSLGPDTHVRRLLDGSLPKACALPREHTDQTVQAAFVGVSAGFTINTSEREMISSHGACPTYGELLLNGVSRIFGRVQPAGRSFLDMGSGVGRAVISAAVGYPLRYADGVELSNTRTLEARKALANLRSQTGKPWDNIRFHEADMLAFDISEYDIIFISNLCFGKDFDRRLGAKFDQDITRRTHIFSSRIVEGQRGRQFPPIDGIEMSWNNNSSLYHAVWGA